MKRYTMFMDWKNQHCENDSTTQTNLQIQCNPYQTITGIFNRTRTKNFTICVEKQKTPNSQSNLKKEKQIWRSHPNFETYYKATIIKTLSYWHKDRHRSMGQNWESRKRPIHLWLIFNKGAKKIQWEKNNLFNKWCWDNWISSGKRMKLDPYLTPHINMNWKWFIDLNVGAKL